VDPSLARLRDQVCNVIEQKNSREASPGSPNTMNMDASALSDIVVLVRFRG